MRAYRSRKRDDRLLLVDQTGARTWIRLAKIRDVTRTTRNTPDGREFLAYTYLAGRRRQLNPKVRSELREIGIAANIEVKRLSLTKWHKLEALFKRSPSAKR